MSIVIRALEGAERFRDYTSRPQGVTLWMT